MSVFSKPGEAFDFTYLSLGAGVQSTALLVLSNQGKAPRADVAIFADTGDEPSYIYDYLDVLREWSEIPIETVGKGRLSEWVIDRQRAGKRFVNVPLYTASPDGGKEGMLRRQCTREFKIEPIEKAVRALLGYRPRQRIRARVRSMQGISLDEAHRMNVPKTSWITNRYPLVEMELRRGDCRRIVVEAGLPEPKKSACVYCPFRSDLEFLDMKENHPGDFAAAVEFDRGARDMTMRGRRQPAYVHRSCRPLDEVEFDPSPGQSGMWGAECEGMCGV